jgi:cytochrome c oxidase assembly protein subunit 15
VSVETTTTAPRARPRRVVSPRRYAQLALASVLSLYAIIVTGATVRLTGSGLGCEGWPGCEPGAFFPARDYHAFVEFGNRAVAILPLSLTLLAWLAATRTPALPKWTTWVAAGTFLGTAVQAPLGRVTIMLDLHPLMVMVHFLLAVVVLGAAVVVAMEAWATAAGRGERVGPPWLRATGVVVAVACTVLIVTGTLATAAGPHPGDKSDIGRYGNLLDAVRLHVRATAVFGIGFLLLLGWLFARRRETGRLFAAALVLLALLLAQMAVGELQWRNQLPWWLVLVHVALAAAVFAWTIALVAALFRPPLSLVRRH